MSKSHAQNPDAPARQVLWVASSRKDLSKFPQPVQLQAASALAIAVEGEKADCAVVMKGFGGASVLEIKANDNTDTYRVVYTVQFEKAVYVLHAFQKKSKSGISTDLQDVNLVRTRLKAAKTHYKENFPP